MFRGVDNKELFDAEVARVFTSYPDQNQYINKKAKSIPPKDHTDLIQLDPDNILSPKQKVCFRKLCQEFKDIIRPEPGRYNGAVGYIDNSINFSSKPPPNKKIYQQKLTDEMKKKLGEKLDQLIEWGVLVYPEKVGVRVEFVSPSKILPKAEPDEFRAITDFSPLNKFVIKPQGVAPTIQEAKDALAKAKYHCHLDLSIWFYQSGMAREDMQILRARTPHPQVKSPQVKQTWRLTQLASVCALSQLQKCQQLAPGQLLTRIKAQKRLLRRQSHTRLQAVTTSKK